MNKINYHKLKNLNYIKEYNSILINELNNIIQNSNIYMSIYLAICVMMREKNMWVKR